MASVAIIATSVDEIAMVEMANGPSSLQTRSIRRIRAFKTVRGQRGTMDVATITTDLVGQVHPLR
jgi:hypothetical protein